MDGVETHPGSDQQADKDMSQLDLVVPLDYSQIEPQRTGVRLLRR